MIPVIVLFCSSLIYLAERSVLKLLTEKGFKDDLRGNRIDFHVALVSMGAFVAALVVRVVTISCSFAGGEALIRRIDRQVVAAMQAVGEAFRLFCHLIVAAIHIKRDANHQCVGLPALD